MGNAMHSDGPVEGEGGAGFEIMLGAFADLGEKHERSNHMLGKALASPKPIRRPVGTSLIGNGAAAQLIASTLVMSPSAGRVWAIRRVAFYGSDGHTLVAAAAADVYAGPGTDPDFQAQFQFASPVPSISTYGNDRVWLTNSDQIYAWIYGPVAVAQQIVMTCWIDEYSEDEMSVNSV